MRCCSDDMGRWNHIGSRLRVSVVRDPEKPHWPTASLYAFAIAGYPLTAAIAAFLSLNNRLLAIPYRALVVVFSLFVFGRTLARGRMYMGLAWFPLGIFWFLYLLRLVLDTVLMPVHLQTHIPDLFLGTIGWSLIPMLPFLSIDTASGTLRLALRMTFIAAFLGCVIALYLSVHIMLAGIGGRAWEGRLSLEALNPVSLGHLGVSVTLLGLFLLVRASIRGMIMRSALIAAIGSGLVTTIATGSRGPILALVATMPLMAWLALGRYSRTRIIAIGLAIAGFAIAAAQVVDAQLGLAVVSRIAAATSSEGDQSTQLRRRVMFDAFDQFEENPILGNAIEETQSGSYPHNAVLESLMATGILGGVAFLSLIVISCMHLIRLVRSSPESGWICLLYAQMLVGAQVSGAIYQQEAMWSLMLGVIALGWRKQKRRSRVQTSQARPFVTVTSFT